MAVANNENPFARLGNTPPRKIHLVHAEGVAEFRELPCQPDNGVAAAAGQYSFDILKQEPGRTKARDDVQVGENQAVPGVAVVTCPSRAKPLAGWAACHCEHVVPACPGFHLTDNPSGPYADVNLNYGIGHVRAVGGHCVAIQFNGEGRAKAGVGKSPRKAAGTGKEGNHDRNRHCLKLSRIGTSK